MRINKKEIGIGAFSLIISAVLQAIVSCKYQNDWFNDFVCWMLGLFLIQVSTEKV
jgi:hypothetical protein